MPAYTIDDIPADLASEALAVQDACNLSGVLHSAAKACAKLQEHPHYTGTDWRNGHPVMVLYADKIASLTGATESAMRGTLTRVYLLCGDAAERED